MNVSGLLKMVYRSCYPIATKLPLQNLERTLLARSMHCVCSNKLLPSVAVTSNVTLGVAQPSELLKTRISPLVLQSCGMKVKARLKLRCKGCYYVRREERLYVMCKLKPRHKQMAMKARPKKSWILTHATQTVQRDW